MATTASSTPYDELATALPDAAELELPKDWVTRQLDPTVPLDDDLIVDFDPFLGLLTCAPGVLREGPEAVWSERSIVGPTEPLTDGLLSVRATIERESAADHENDRDGLAACTPITDQVFVERSAVTIDVAGRVVDGDHLRLSAAPTEDVPFPSSFSYVVVHVDEVTATVLLSGLDLGQDWTSRSARVAGRILERAG